MECMVDIHESGFLKNITSIYVGNNQVVPFSVKVRENSIYVFAVVPIDLEAKKEAVSFDCNSLPAHPILHTKVYATNHVSIFQCGENLMVNKGDNLIFTVNEMKESNVSYSYDVTNHLDCQYQENMFLDAFRNERNITNGVIAVFNGNENRERALEWATYHNLVGFDHIFLYFNEPWNNGMDEYKRDYITWVPFAAKVNNGGLSWEIFRIAGMTDMFWNARFLGMKWLLNIDIDEYFWFDSEYDNSTDPVKSYLGAFQNSSKVGIHLNSISYGANRSIEYDQHVPRENCTILDYVFRQKIDVRRVQWDRLKMIANIQSDQLQGLTHHGCHEGFRNKVCPTYRELPSIARINHYKKPEYGVFNKTKETIQGLDQIENDFSLFNRYKLKLEQKLRMERRMSIPS